MANPFSGMRSAFPWGPPRDDPKETYLAMKTLIDSIHTVKERKATDSFLSKIGEARTHEEAVGILNQMSKDRRSRKKAEGFFNGMMSTLDSFNPLTAQRGMAPVEQQFRLSSMQREFNRGTALKDFYTKADYSSQVRMDEHRQKQDIEDKSVTGKARTEYYKHMGAYHKARGEKLSKAEFDQAYPDTDFGYLLSQLTPEQRTKAIEIRAKVREAPSNSGESLRLKMQYRDTIKDIVDSTQDIKYDVTGNVKSKKIKNQKLFDSATRKLAELDTELLQLGVGQDGQAVLPGDKPPAQEPGSEPEGSRGKKAVDAVFDGLENSFMARSMELRSILEDQTISEEERGRKINLMSTEGLSEEEIERLKAMVMSDREIREALEIK